MFRLTLLSGEDEECESATLPVDAVVVELHVHQTAHVQTDCAQLLLKCRNIAK